MVKAPAGPQARQRYLLTCPPRQHGEQLLLQVALGVEAGQLAALVGLDHRLAQRVLLAGHDGDLADSGQRAAGRAVQCRGRSGERQRSAKPTSFDAWSPASRQAGIQTPQHSPA